MRWFISIVLAAMVCGCTQNKDETPKKVDNAALVTLAAAETRDVPYIIEAVGTVKPSTTVTLVSRTAGELQKVLVRDGDDVSQGQILFEIEKAPYAIAQKQAAARLGTPQLDGGRQQERHRHPGQDEDREPLIEFLVVHCHSKLL